MSANEVESVFTIFEQFLKPFCEYIYMYPNYRFVFIIFPQLKYSQIFLSFVGILDIVYIKSAKLKIILIINLDYEAIISNIFL